MELEGGVTDTCGTNTLPDTDKLLTVYGDQVRTSQQRYLIQPRHNPLLVYSDHVTVFVHKYREDN